jgi:two-component system phosphate regulon response regulator PhoB
LPPDGLVKIKELVLDTNSNKLSINSQEVLLSLLEYKLLLFLLSHKDHICTREKLLDHVWGRTAEVDLRTVDVQIRRLRDKLKPHGYEGHIHTKRGVGYVFNS